MNDSIAYYENNTQAFIDSSVNVDMSLDRTAFLSFLPQEAKILDLGCGSGRDTKAFSELGYDVTAIDGSPALCEYASQYSGHQVDYMRLRTYAGLRNSMEYGLQRLFCTSQKMR